MDTDFLFPDTGKTRAGAHDAPAGHGFAIVSYGNGSLVEWSDFTDQKELPALDEAIWQRGDRPPRMGERRILKVHYPFNLRTGEVFWSLFMPSLSFFNGWEYAPGEIETSAMARCRFEDVIGRDGQTAWVRVEVLDVILLPDICGRIPVSSFKGGFDLFDYPAMSHLSDFGQWVECQWSAQGDCGAWGLLKKHGGGSARLVLYGEWRFSAETVCCGNMEIPAAVYQDFVKKVNK